MLELVPRLSRRQIARTWTSEQSHLINDSWYVNWPIDLDIHVLSLVLTERVEHCYELHNRDT